MKKRYCSLSELPLLETEPSKSPVAPDAGLMIKLIGVLASAAGQRQVDLASENPGTVSEMIQALLAKVGKRQFEEYLLDSATRDPRPNVIILLDEQDCNLVGGLKANVRDKRTVTIIPVAHGG